MPDSRATRCTEPLAAAGTRMWDRSVFTRAGIRNCTTKRTASSGTDASSRTSSGKPLHDRDLRVDPRGGATTRSPFRQRMWLTIGFVNPAWANAPSHWRRQDHEVREARDGGGSARGEVSRWNWSMRLRPQPGPTPVCARLRERGPRVLFSNYSRGGRQVTAVDPGVRVPGESEAYRRERNRLLEAEVRVAAGGRAGRRGGRARRGWACGG